MNFGRLTVWSPVQQAVWAVQLLVAAPMWTQLMPTVPVMPFRDPPTDPMSSATSWLWACTVQHNHMAISTVKKMSLHFGLIGSTG